MKDKNLFSTAQTLRKITSASIMTRIDEKNVSREECAKKNIFFFSQRTILQYTTFLFIVSNSVLLLVTFKNTDKKILYS